MSTFYCDSEEHGIRYLKPCEVFQKIICCACCPANNCEDSEFPNEKKKDGISLDEVIKSVEISEERDEDFIE